MQRVPGVGDVVDVCLDHVGVNTMESSLPQQRSRTCKLAISYSTSITWHATSELPVRYSSLSDRPCTTSRANCGAHRRSPRTSTGAWAWRGRGGQTSRGDNRWASACGCVREGRGGRGEQRKSSKGAAVVICKNLPPNYSVSPTWCDPGSLERGGVRCHIHNPCVLPSTDTQIMHKCAPNAGGFHQLLLWR